MSKLQTGGSVIIVTQPDSRAPVYMDTVMVEHNPLWIQQAVRIRPDRSSSRQPTNTYPQLNITAILSPFAFVDDSRFEVQFSFLKLSGSLEVGDVRVMFTHCILDGLLIKESFHIRPSILQPAFSFQFSKVYNLVFNYGHELKVERPAVVNKISLLVSQCSFIDYSITLRANDTDTQIADSTFEGTVRGSFVVANSIPFSLEDDDAVPGTRPHPLPPPPFIPEHMLPPGSSGGRPQPLIPQLPEPLVIESRPTPPPPPGYQLLVITQPLKFTSYLRITNTTFSGGQNGVEISTTNRSNVDIILKDSKMSQLQKGLVCIARDVGVINVYLLNTTFADITSAGHGGALSIQVTNLQSSVQILNCTFARNTAMTRVKRHSSTSFKKDEPGRGGAVAIGSFSDHQTAKVKKCNTQEHCFVVLTAIDNFCQSEKLSNSHIMCTICCLKLQ